MRRKPKTETREAAATPHQGGRRPSWLSRGRLAPPPEVLREALQSSPTVRPEEVARARALVRNTSYPPDGLISQVASLLAVHLASPEPGLNPNPTLGR